MLHRLHRQVFGAAGRRPAAVPHENVDALERLVRLLDEPLEISRARDVPADRERSDPLGLALEQVAAAREHGDVRTLGRERLGRGESQAGGGAEHDRRAAFQPEVHVAPDPTALVFAA